MQTKFSAEQNIIAHKDKTKWNLFLIFLKQIYNIFIYTTIILLIL